MPSENNKISRTVWWEEVNKGFLNVLNRIYANNVQISFRSDDDIQQDNVSYPRILITNLEEKFDRSRYNDSRVEVLSTDTSIITEDPAKPYNLNIQFDLTTKYLSDMNELTMLWNSYFLDWDNLDVVDTGGTPRSVPIKNVFKTQSSDKSVEGERLFKKTYIYEVKVEIDETFQTTHARPHKGLEF